MGTSQPFVSVIISTYNSERFIKGRIENLIGQTIFGRTEIIVVNSGSLQGEEQIVQEYARTYANIKYLRTEKRETIYRAWNRGIQMARGKYITNANTDDTLRYDALEILASALDARPAVAVVYADQRLSNTPNETFDHARRGKRIHRGTYSRIGLLQGYLAGSQSMWRASLHLTDNLWFDEECEVAGDYAFLCAVAERYDIEKIDQVLGLYYKAPDKSNKEFSDLPRTLGEAMAIQEKYGRRYVASLTPEQRRRLFAQCVRRMWIPRPLFRVAREAAAVVSPSLHISSRMFWCWLGSLIKEEDGDIDSAKKCCPRVYLNGSENLVRRQYDRLITNHRQ